MPDSFVATPGGQQRAPLRALGAAFDRLREAMSLHVRLHVDEETPQIRGLVNQAGHKLNECFALLMMASAQTTGLDTSDDDSGEESSTTTDPDAIEDLDSDSHVSATPPPAEDNQGGQVLDEILDAAFAENSQHGQLLAPDFDDLVMTPDSPLLYERLDSGFAFGSDSGGARRRRKRKRRRRL